ncbi:MAG: hypothetical protein GY766_20325 [Herbaspirillum sp.]|uniref:hypothetical protein n=1 Tax=Herbaspirillum sp. TaxID=1890675 RepID=UPI0025887E2A|nr:hypothetical protein [Herbaspirillum sp.]MCP3657206.1 hypothetical protein [Herbaspirillum sp.]
MAITTTNITGDIALPDGTIPSKSSVTFTMTGFDTDATAGVTIAPRSVTSVLSDTGALDVDLWSNEDGERTTFYSVSLNIYNGTNPLVFDAGKIEVPTTGGPYDLNDLLPIAPPSGATVDEYIAQLAASVAAVEAAETNALAAETNALASEVAAAASAAEAALYDGVWLDDVSDLIADTALTYTASQPGTVVAGDIVQTRAEGFSYEVAASGATDGHLETAGGVKLYVLQAGGVRPEQFIGTVTPGTTDMTDAITDADARARVLGVPLVLSGEYRTISTITLTAETIVSHGASIVKDLNNTEVVRFQGSSGGAMGQFRTMIGRLKASQSASPDPTTQTTAHAYIFEDVINSEFGTLDSGHCAYAFVNDETSGHGLCWGNVFKSLITRGAVQGYMYWDFPGSGGHTGNVFLHCYFKGQEVGSTTLLDKHNYPLYFNNMDGFDFRVLSVEHTRTADGISFIRMDNQGAMQIGQLRLEGSEHVGSTSRGIFEFSNAGTVKAAVNIENIHLNDVTVSIGTLSLLSASTASKGGLTVSTFTGTVATNSFSDFRALDTDGPASVVIGENSGCEDYFTSMTNLIKGALPSGFRPNLWVGGAPYQRLFLIENPGASVDIGQSDFMRFTGASTASLSTVNATDRSGERTRVITMQNSTSGDITITGGGNINRPSNEAFDLTWPTARTLIGVYNFINDKFDIIGLT